MQRFSAVRPVQLVSGCVLVSVTHGDQALKPYVTGKVRRSRWRVMVYVIHPVTLLHGQCNHGAVSSLAVSPCVVCSANY